MSRNGVKIFTMVMHHVCWPGLDPGAAGWPQQKRPETAGASAAIPGTNSGMRCDPDLPAGCPEGQDRARRTGPGPWADPCEEAALARRPW